MVNMRKNPLGAWEPAPYLGRHFPLRKASSRSGRATCRAGGMGLCPALPWRGSRGWHLKTSAALFPAPRPGLRGPGEERD